MQCIDEEDVVKAVDEGAKLYFNHCRSRIEGFIANHFEYSNAWSTNRKALGWDLLRSPFNLFWAPIYLFIKLACFLLSYIPWQKLNLFTKTLSHNIPSGMTTNVQTYLSDKIQQEILSDPNGNRHSLSNWIGESISSKQGKVNENSETIQILKDTLSQYSITRTASADISNSLLTTIIGAFWFKKFTPGGVAIGIVFAYWLNRNYLASNFFFGDFLGDVYYQLSPPSPSTSLIIISTAFSLSALSILASFSGLISDPIQSICGLHKRRLLRMIDAMEADFQLGEGKNFRPKDQYVARILDVLDAAKSAII